jgi:hypothetical protein
VIESYPAGATLWVDGREVGIAPQTIQVPLNGEISLRGELTGRTPATRKVQLRNAQEKVLLRLERQKPQRPLERGKPQPANVPFDPNGVGG